MHKNIGKIKLIERRLHNKLAKSAKSEKENNVVKQFG